jgi:GAF domain-containing protein
VDPVTASHYHLQLDYLRTETEGPLFEAMRARLAAIASHTGMSKVFRLLGADLYRVMQIDPVGEPRVAQETAEGERIATLRTLFAAVSGCTDLASLLERTLYGLDLHWGVRHGMVLMVDATRNVLYTVASRGYPQSGVGSEIGIGQGIIGIAAQERTSIRLGYAVQDYRYCQATRRYFAASGKEAVLETEIPLPGLPEANSQMAAPLLSMGRLLGVLYLESPQEQRFGYDDEDAIALLASQLAAQIDLLDHCSQQPEETASLALPATARGNPALVRYFPADRSVFVGGDYLIKGVAGAIIWKLLREHQQTGRVDFTSRELRLDSSLKLPDIVDNLDARLILLQRRLSERCAAIALEKTGRGRFRLKLARPVTLREMPG